MSLHVYTSEDLIPKDMQYIIYNDDYFDLHHTMLPDTDMVQFLLEYIEGAKYQTEKTFVGKFVPDAGVFNTFLSTGVKTALNILLSPDTCFDSLSCGEKSLNGIIFIPEGHVVIEDGFSMHTDGNIDVILDNRYQFFTVKDYIHFLCNQNEVGYDKTV